MDLLALLLFTVIFFGGILPLRCGWIPTAVSALLAAFAAFKFQLVYLLFGGPRYSIPDIDGGWIGFLGWLYAVALFFACLLPIFWLLFGCVWSVSFLGGKGWGAILPAVRSYGILFSLLVALILASIGLASAVSSPRVRERSLEIFCGTEEPKEMTIAVLADLHIDRLTNRRRVREMVDRANGTGADLIVVLGDLADGRCSRLSEAVSGLRHLHARYGVYLIPGNHEYYSNFKAWLPYYEKWGLPFLLNRNVILPNGIALAGITDPSAGEEGLPGPDLDQALAGIPVSSPTILLSHRPAYAPIAARKGVSLQLSGHTHGGMLPMLDRLVARANGGYVRGLYQVGDLALFVSPGTSLWNGFPIRLGVPPEITLLRLRFLPRAD